MIYAEKINGAWVAKTPAQFCKEREANIPDSRLEEKGLYQITEGPRPAVSDTERAVPGPIEDRDNRPFRTWSVLPKPPEQIAAERLAARERMQVERWQFATAAMAVGIVSAQEAIDWAAGNALPAGVEAALDEALSAVPMAPAGAKVKALASATIRRTNDLIGLLQAPGAFNLTDEQVDDLFTHAASLE